MKKRVLFVDNDPEFLDTRSERLERAGFDVFKATSFEQAEQILRDYWVHLAIIDLRLRDESDDRDISGLTLAKKDAYRPVPKIILTKFPTYEAVREAMGPALTGLPAAVDFLAKKDGGDTMMQVIEDVFARYIHINWNLAIHWGEQLSFLQLADQIEPKVDREHISDRADELADLFRLLFYDSSQITIGRLLVRAKKKITLTVFAFSETGIVNRFVVTCGQRDIIQQEQANYDDYAPKTTGGTAKHASVETLHFAAIAYILTGADLEEITPLSKFYHQNPAEKVIKTLDYLFNTTLIQWHGQDLRLVNKGTLNKAFMPSFEVAEENLSSELESRIQAIQSQALVKNLPGFDEVLLKLSDLIGDAVDIDTPLRYGIIHRQLQADNILVDRQGKTWLIDFSRVGQGPLVYDYVSLEKTVKFDLLTTLDGQERYELEKSLLADPDPDRKTIPDSMTPEVQKAFQIIDYIRQQVLKVCSEDMRPYQFGLLFSAVEKLTAYKPEVYHTPYELACYLHSFLSAGLLCRGLKLAESKRNFSIDYDNKVVKVAGKPVKKLTKLQFKLLMYLDKNQDRVCSRDELLDHLYQEEAHERLDSALDAHISRLRQKVEPDPANPRFIVTVSGYGYKLVK